MSCIASKSLDQMWAGTGSSVPEWTRVESLRQTSESSSFEAWWEVGEGGEEEREKHKDPSRRQD